MKIKKLHCTSCYKLYKSFLGSALLANLADLWDQFHGDALPTLQLVFHAARSAGRELPDRSAFLINFRDRIILRQFDDIKCIIIFKMFCDANSKSSNIISHYKYSI